MKKRIGTLVAACSMLALGGCYESPSVTVHDPGVYKGPQDPLAKSSAASRTETLQKRFTLVQTDR